MATRKTTKAKTETKTKAAITIAEDEADIKRRETHQQNIEKVAKNNNKDVEQGKDLNHKTYEFVCDDCLDEAATNGEVFCLYEETLNEYGRCKCGKYTTHKAILL